MQARMCKHTKGMHACVRRRVACVPRTADLLRSQRMRLGAAERYDYVTILLTIWRYNFQSNLEGRTMQQQSVVSNIMYK